MALQARLRFSEEVQQSDVDEGIRLMYESKRSLYDEANPSQRSYDPTSTIFEMAKNVALASDSSSIKVADLEQRALMKGFTRAQLMECIKQYETLSVWMQVSAAHLTCLGIQTDTIAACARWQSRVLTRLDVCRRATACCASSTTCKCQVQCQGVFQTAGQNQETRNQGTKAWDDLGRAQATGSSWP